MFVDGEGLTCYNRSMMVEQLNKHLYTRWLEFPEGKQSSGTVYGITEYSMICLKSRFQDFTIPAFLCEYVRMAELVLAQRATLLMFENLLSDCALGFGSVRKIEEKYILFQSQLLLNEISPEQQPIEIYNELLEKTFIIRESEQIESQIRNLFELENYKMTKRENRVLFLLALLGLAEAFSFIKELSAQGVSWWSYLIWAGIWTTFGIFAVFLLHPMRKRKRRKEKDNRNHFN